jgi:hypothetical protein
MCLIAGIIILIVVIVVPAGKSCLLYMIEHFTKKYDSRYHKALRPPNCYKKINRTMLHETELAIVVRSGLLSLYYEVRHWGFDPHLHATLAGYENARSRMVSEQEFN